MPNSDDNARLLAAIIESSDDAIVSKDVRGIVRSWNRGAERIFGFTAEEMIGQSIRKIIPADRQHEEDRVLASVMAGERVDHFDTIRRTKDGRLIPISLTVSPIRDSSGQVVGASKIARDISDRRRAEMLVAQAARRDAFLAHVTLTLSKSLDYEQTLKELAAIAVPTLGDYCLIDVVNDEDELRRLAVVHASEEKARLFEGLRDERDETRDSIAHQVVRTKARVVIPRVTDDFVIERGHGDPDRLARIRALDLTSLMCLPMIAREEVVGVVTLATAESRVQYTEDDVRLAEDVASRAALGIENARAYREVRRANRLKDEFLANLSHELRTPLNAVLGYVRMLRTGAIRPEKSDQALGVIERNADALRQIVEDVLDVSRIISGKARLDVRPTDVARVVKDAIATVQPAADAKGIRVEQSIDPGVGAVSADPNRLQQVVWNVLSNAVKFTPSGGAVHVSLRLVEDRAEITVRDTGIGLTSGFLPHVFERFRQAEAGTTRRHGGLGLGLAIARHIVEMQGGTIEASSEGEGKGSTFTINLPVMPLEPGTTAGRRAGAELRSPTHQFDLAGIRVLAVDDDEDALYLVREILEAAGADVITVTSAGAALDRLSAQRPHVLVADLGMPEMDGFQLIQEIRQLTDSSLRRVPAAALTAYARATERARALRSGFEMHLAKPIDPVELVAAVGSLARRDRT
jgi:PAS domain S-box-containing protein